MSSLILCMACAKSHPRWIVYYGSQLTKQDLKGVDWAIVEPALTKPGDFQDQNTRLIAYISLGEVHQTRDYWSKLKQAGALIEPNPHWEGAYRIDIRNPVWQSLLLDEIIPQLVNQGFKGLFFDTVDTAHYFETLDSQKFSGSVKTLVDLMFEIKHRFPDLLLVPNNGLEFIEQYAEVIDAVVVEDLFLSYDFEKKRAIPSDDLEDKSKEKKLDLFLHQYKKPVLVLIYGKEAKDPLVSQALNKIQTKKYSWYLTDIHLENLGTQDQNP